MARTLKEIIAEEFGVAPETITPDTAFVEDLGADSLDMVDLLMSLEDAYEMEEVDEEVAANVHTVRDVMRIIGEEL